MDDENNASLRIKSEIRRQLLRELADKTETADYDELKRIVGDLLTARGVLAPKTMIESLADELKNELYGFGPLEVLLKDPGISEIMVNGCSEIFIEKGGRIEKTDVTFEADFQLLETIRRIINPLNLRIDDMSPMVDARLPDGSRLNSIIPPLCLNGPSLTIRKFRPVPFSITDLIDNKTLSVRAASFLQEAVSNRKNIIISGGTSSGKTTFLNVLSCFIPEGERIITIEDAAELKINHQHVVTLESRPANIEGKGEVTVRELVRNALRMRPDRIVVGEVRGAETLDMLQAMNTGHPGSLTTAHANSASDLLNRLETMVLMSDTNLDLNSVRRQIGSAIDLIIHMQRNSSGRRILGGVFTLSIDNNLEYRLERLFPPCGSAFERVAAGCNENEE